jgi:hypothetical protein
MKAKSTLLKNKQKAGRINPNPDDTPNNDNDPYIDLEDMNDEDTSDDEDYDTNWYDETIRDLFIMGDNVDSVTIDYDLLNDILINNPPIGHVLLAKISESLEEFTPESYYIYRSFLTVSNNIIQSGKHNNNPPLQGFLRILGRILEGYESNYAQYLTSRRGGKKVKRKSKSKSKKARKNNKRKTKRNKKHLKGG